VVSLPAEPARERSNASASSDPELEELLRGWAHFHQEVTAGAIDPTGEHPGQYAAFARGQVIDFGTDPRALRREAAARLQTDPEKVVISFLDNNI
jgi:hypothetical protein